MISIIVGVISIYQGASAGTPTGNVKLNKIGCHLMNATCYVYIDQIVGPDTCRSNSLRWSKDSATSGKETLALLHSAFLADKNVFFNIADECYGDYPTFTYFNINNE